MPQSVRIRHIQQLVGLRQSNAQALITPEDVSRDIEAVASAIGKRYDGDAFNRVVYTESHDEVANGRSRIPEEIWPGNIDN